MTGGERTSSRPPAGAEQVRATSPRNTRASRSAGTPPPAGAGPQEPFPDADAFAPGASARTPDDRTRPPGKARRADARRNQEALLDAAAAVFVESGVEAPIREIAARAGVGTATIYRHFPTRADLIVAVYRHQVEALAVSVPTAAGPHAALAEWLDEFVDFVVTKQGLPAALQSADPCYDPLHDYFVERLEPVCRRLLDAAVTSGEIAPGQDPYELMRAVGSLCAGAGTTRPYDPRRLVGLLVAGLRRPA